ncbi:MAG: type II toxin-antitoxin system VapB family antitoxin [Chromatiaceae bacterium]|jgi:hypothetical protein
MRTTMVLDDALIDEAMRDAEVKPKRELVDLALRELVAARRRCDVSELFGKVQIDPDYDHRVMRGAQYR